MPRRACHCWLHSWASAGSWWLLEGAAQLGGHQPRTMAAQTTVGGSARIGVFAVVFLLLLAMAILLASRFLRSFCRRTAEEPTADTKGAQPQRNNARKKRRGKGGSSRRGGPRVRQKDGGECMQLRFRGQSGPNEMGYAGCAGLSAAELGSDGVVIIDVMNVRGQFGFARADLVQFCGAVSCWARSNNMLGRVLLAVDHGPEQRVLSYAGLCFCFAGTRMKADDTIVFDIDWFVRHLQVPLVIVTVDRELKRRCHRAFSRALKTLDPATSEALIRGEQGPSSANSANSDSDDGIDEGASTDGTATAATSAAGSVGQRNRRVNLMRLVNSTSFANWLGVDGWPEYQDDCESAGFCYDDNSDDEHDDDNSAGHKKRKKKKKKKRSQGRRGRQGAETTADRVVLARDFYKLIQQRIDAPTDAATTAATTGRKQGRWHEEYGEWVHGERKGLPKYVL